MKTKFILSILIPCVLLIGDIHAQNWPGIRDSIYSDILKESRRIQVILPDGYKEDPRQTYEVLYVLDGEWYMQQIPFIYNFTTSSGYTPKNIFVLIPNRYVDEKNLRDRDFSPTQINEDTISGGADNFHAFLKRELIPYVEQKYRTNGSRSLVGSSFSGLFSVYAFVKDPQLFRSYVASDPNLNWDDNYVSKLAAEKLPTFSEIRSTMYIAGLTTTFGAMGIAAMDTVLKQKAPPSIKWKCVPYENETHYSVQHKAFYDGFRFSHLGYSTSAPEYHPMNGILEEGKPIQLLVLKENAALRYTTDGSEPDDTSPPMSQREVVSILPPAKLNVKAVSNRSEYVQQVKGEFTLGQPLSATKLKSSKAGLKYSLYEGDWDKLPQIARMKPVKTGTVDQSFNINLLAGEKKSLIIIEGSMDIPEDAYYVFYVQSNASKLRFGDQLIIDSEKTGLPGQSFVLPIKKGLYPLRLELLKKTEADQAYFFMWHTKPGNSRWWDTRFFQL